MSRQKFERGCVIFFVQRGCVTFYVLRGCMIFSPWEVTWLFLSRKFAWFFVPRGCVIFFVLRGCVIFLSLDTVCFFVLRCCVIFFVQKFLNPKGHQNPISGSKVTAILMKGGILPIGGVASGRVWACSLRSRLVSYLFYLALYGTWPTPGCGRS